MLKITTYPRLHITLIGMNNSGYRINGGIGFSIDSMQLNFIIEESKVFHLVDNREFKLDEIQALRIADIINKIKIDRNFKGNISIEINGDMPTHSGFGSGTIIRLACIEALFLINDSTYNDETLIKLSGRGGTSGIGVRTFFHGGFVFEIGHKNAQELLPSGFVEDLGRSSLLVENGPMPDWEIGIFIPKDIKTLNQNEEKLFFEKTIPIEDKEVFATLYHVVFGLYASIKENDINTFSKALKEIQKCKWKYLERNIYGPKLMQYENLIYNCGADAVGMSSLGPSLFFISNNLNFVISNLENNNNSSNFRVLKTKTLNSSRIIH